MHSLTNDLSPDKYLEWEPRQELRYEYIDGEVFAMTGGTVSHNTIAVNLTTALRNHVRGTGYRVFTNDVKLRVSEKGPFHYPDVMVTCDPRDKAASKFIQYPCLVIEVLSDSTEAYDRGGKFRSYRRIETLQEYVLIEQKIIAVDIYKLVGKKIWELHSYEQKEEIRFESLGFNFPINTLYEDVDLSQPEEI